MRWNNTSLKSLVVFGLGFVWSTSSFALLNILPDFGVSTQATAVAGVHATGTVELIKIDDEVGIFCSAQAGPSIDVGASLQTGLVQPIGCDSIDDYSDKFLTFFLGFDGLGPIGAGLSISIGLDSTFFTQLAEARQSHGLTPLQMGVDLRKLQRRLRKSTDALLTELELRADASNSSSKISPKSPRTEEGVASRFLKLWFQYGLTCTQEETRQSEFCLTLKRDFRPIFNRSFSDLYDLVKRSHSPTSKALLLPLSLANSYNANRLVHRLIYNSIHQIIEELANDRSLPSLSHFFNLLYKSVSPCGSLAMEAHVAWSPIPVNFGISISHYLIASRLTDGTLTESLFFGDGLDIAEKEKRVLARFLGALFLKERLAGLLTRDLAECHRVAFNRLTENLFHIGEFFGFEASNDNIFR
jgi:hypothetical protein